MKDRQVLATFPDGSQVLVTLWSGGAVEVARRDRVGDIWGPPAPDAQLITLDTVDGRRVAS